MLISCVRLKGAGKKTILFIDEIHRFNKAQQDVLLPFLEKGTVSLIGATTHNPCFSLNAPLLSRSLIFELRPLGKGDLRAIIERAVADREKGLGETPVEIEEGALNHIVSMCEGDARRALNSIERAVLTTPPSIGGVVRVTLKVAEECVQRKAVVYDRDEDGHYDTASAFIKSMRGSDPDASLYWMAKMIYAGEDPRFIARRILICAAEDVGNADPHALLVANAAMAALEFIGMPEARIPLAQAAVYIACAPKSNAAYKGIEKALEDVRTLPTMQVPEHLRDASYPGAARLGRGKGYKYSHDYKGPEGAQLYMPRTARYYEPEGSGYEKVIKERLSAWRRLRAGVEAARDSSGAEDTTAEVNGGRRRRK
jgi:putative ATPase